MTIIDLAKYDVLDLLMTSTYPEEKRGHLIFEYMKAFAGFFSEAVANRLTDKDEEEMTKLLYSPDITPDKIEKFYKDRVPDYDAFLLAAVVRFKKDYLMFFYQQMKEVTKKAQDKSAPFWEEITKQAEIDDWEKVYDMVKQVERSYLNPQPKTSK